MVFVLANLASISPVHVLLPNIIYSLSGCVHHCGSENHVESYQNILRFSFLSSKLLFIVFIVCREVRVILIFSLPRLSKLESIQIHMSTVQINTNITKPGPFDVSVRATTFYDMYISLHWISLDTEHSSAQNQVCKYMAA